MESFSLYIHIFSRSYSFLSYVEKKSYWALKILKKSYSKLVIKYFKKILNFFLFTLYYKYMLYNDKVYKI